MNFRFALLIGTAMSGLMSANIASADLGDPAGVAGAVQGQVGLRSPAKQQTEPQPVASGDGVVMGDEISTQAASRLQVLLLDETTITIGQNAFLTIDEFVYDPAGGSGSLGASLSNGPFRLVTGGVARQNADGTKVKLPSAVLTIRGTTVLGNCDDSGCIVSLAGTGDENTAGKKPSDIVIQTEKGTVILKRSGFFVLISPDGTISDPEPLTDEAILRLGQIFDTPFPGTQFGEAENPVDESEQPKAEGGENSEREQIYRQASAKMEEGYESVAVIGERETTPPPPPPPPPPTLRYLSDPITLTSATPGVSGNYVFDLTVDLGSRKHSGQVDLTVSGLSTTPINGTFELLKNPLPLGKSVTESGAVITTPDNDSIIVNYTLGKKSAATGVTYSHTVPVSTVPITTTLTGSGPAPVQ